MIILSFVDGVIIGPYTMFLGSVKPAIITGIGQAKRDHTDLEIETKCCVPIRIAKRRCALMRGQPLVDAKPAKFTC